MKQGKKEVKPKADNSPSKQMSMMGNLFSKSKKP